MKQKRAEEYTPVELAFVGDAVHTLFVRESVIGSGASGALHLTASRYVNAKAQAAVYDELSAAGFFTPEESEIARRAKNAHLRSRTKRATPDDYHKATALEAILGYVHISGDIERERHILDECVRRAQTITQ